MYSVLPVRSHRRLANNVWLKLHEKERSTFQLAFVVVAVDPQINFDHCNWVTDLVPLCFSGAIRAIEITGEHSQVSF